MHTVELLEQALELARRSGYRVRQEWLDGSAGGACVVRDQKWLFIDPARSRQDQLADVLEALWADADVTAIDISAELQLELDRLSQKSGNRKAA